MKRLIAKVNESLKCLLTNKGQGLVEFALIIAFCAGIGIAVREAGFGKAIDALLGSGERPEYETAAIGSARKIDWGKEPFSGDSSTFSEANAAERLAWDQKSLENLAGKFMGMKKSDVKTLFGGKSADMGWGDRGEEVLLGHFVPSKDKQGTVFTPTTLSSAEAMNIFAWLKGDYDTTDGSNYDPEYRYFVSDYTIGQGWADQSGKDQQIGVRLTLEYDRSNPNTNNNDLVVVGVNIAIDPKSQTGEFTDRRSLGLNLQIRSDGTITYNNVGRHFDANMNPTDGWSERGSGLQNWYGDDARVQQSIIDKAVSVSSLLDRGTVVTANDKYYVSLDTGNYSDLTASGNLVEITNKYYHANANNTANSTIKPGDIVIKGAAEAYVYTGNTNKKYKDISESSWLKLSGVSGL